jgi:hypothetical protein
MTSNWIMVRIDKAVHADLERVRTSMLVGELMGLNQLEHDFRDRVSLSQIVERLIAFRDRHAARARRSRERRRERSAEQKGIVDEGATLNEGGVDPDLGQ